MAILSETNSCSVEVETIWNAGCRHIRRARREMTDFVSMLKERVVREGWMP